MSDVAAEVRDRRMRYGTTDALDGIDFHTRTGEVVRAPTDEATAFTRKLLAQYGEAVEDLEVRRANLEDTYMSLAEEFEK